MPERADEAGRLGYGHTEPSGGAPYEEGQSLAAGRAFVGAVRTDLVTLLRCVSRALWSAGKGVQHPEPAHGRRSRGAVVRVVAGLAKMVVLVAVLGSLATAGAMLWALHDFPAEKPVGGNNESSLLLEAANGETLGRVGPLKLADAARTDFPDNLVKAVVKHRGSALLRPSGLRSPRDSQGTAAQYRRRDDCRRRQHDYPAAREDALSRA